MPMVSFMYGCTSKGEKTKKRNAKMTEFWLFVKEYQLYVIPIEFGLFALWLMWRAEKHFKRLEDKLDKNKQ